MRYRISSHTMLPILLLVACLVFGVLAWLDQRPGQTQTDGFQINQLTAIHQTPISSRPTGFVELNGMVYFGLDKYRSYDGYDRLSGLWRTDGTAEGTVMVKDILWNPLTLQRVGDRLYFKTYSAQLWQSDGTAEGTIMLKQNSHYTSNQQMTKMQDSIYFVDQDGEHGIELWRSDGTAAGTALVLDATPGADSTAPMYLTLFDELLYFVGTDPMSGSPRLWVSDGTAAGTQILPDSPTEVTEVARVGDRLFLAASDDATGHELWQYQGGTSTSMLIADLVPGAESTNPARFIEFEGRLIFAANQGDGEVLWGSDGTAAGTQMIAELDLTSSTETIEFAAVTDSLLYFKLYDRVKISPVELWRTDGTTAGTVLIDTFPYYSSPGPVYDVDESPTQFVVRDEMLYFNTYDQELWRSDGSVTGTVQIPTPPINELGLGRDGLSLSLFDEATGYELGFSDGTTAGTRLVKDVDPNDVGTDIRGAVTVNGHVYTVLETDNTSATYQLWMSENATTPASLLDDSYEYYTLRVAGGNLFVIGRSETGYDLLIVNPEINQLEKLQTIKSAFFELSFNHGVLFTEHDRDARKYALWHSDGTAAGTVQLADDIAERYDNPFGPSPDLGLFILGDRVVFISDKTISRSDGTVAGTTSFDLLERPGYIRSRQDSTTFFYLFLNGQIARSDGTEAGTIQLEASPTGGIYRSMVVGDALFFQSGGDLWYHAGSGTELVQLTTGLALDRADVSYEFVGDMLYFVRSDDAYGSELWKSDGTPAGTTQVQQIVPTGVDPYPGPYLYGFQSTLFYSKNDEQLGWELWGSDGTAPGTGLLRDIFPGTESSSPSYFGETDSHILFRATSAAHGRELWQSDGTVGGTELLRDIFPGTAGSNPDRFTAGNGYFLFTAYNETLGRELWQSDGTTAHTQPVIDLYPGRASGDISILGRQDDILLFTGDNGRDGTQLYSLVTVAPRSLPPAEEPAAPDEHAEQIFLPHVNR